MKKWVPYICLWLAGVFCSSGCSREPGAAEMRTTALDIIPEKLAIKFAERIHDGFFKTASGISAADVLRRIDTVLTIRDERDAPALYICNYADSGFIVLSADLMHEPLCAYVPRGRVSHADSVPATLAEWFGRKVEDIGILRNGLYDNSLRAGKAWHHLAMQTGLSGDSLFQRFAPPGDPDYCDECWTVTTVGPLLVTEWGQICSYHEQCPKPGCINICIHQAAPTGCLATAAAQLTRYWEPVSIYNYSYAAMPQKSGNEEVQRLMFDLGRVGNLNMVYSCDGSSAPLSRLTSTLIHRFGFSSGTLKEYGINSYKNVLNNLDKSWPVILYGCNSERRVLLFNWRYEGCHAWICDGYKELENYGFGYLWLHMNWGWNELNSTTNYNGWYSFNNWNIPGINRKYQYARHYAFELHP